MNLIDRVRGKIKKVFKKKKKDIDSIVEELTSTNTIKPDKVEKVNSSEQDFPRAIEGQKATSQSSFDSPVLTEKQQTILEQIVRSSTSEQRLVNRSRIILAYGEGLPKNRIVKKLNRDRKTVHKWCTRWDEAQHLLLELEMKNLEKMGKKGYQAVIVEVLNDAYRNGAPPTFTAEQVTHIVAMACEVLDEIDEGTVSHWTQQHLAESAVKRGIVKQISRSTVGRFLREADLKPHLNRYWLNAPDYKTEDFTHEVQKVCDLYQQTPELNNQGVHVISTDEKTGIQALERDHATHPAQPGGKHPKERREYNYERHGTLCLIANFEVATGHILAPTLGATRTEEDFVNHIKQTVSSYPEGEWIFVVDQLNIHQSEGLVKWVNEHCELFEELGKKGSSGTLASMETRKEFLSDTNHRIRFVYTPKHTSWLNQIEIWFSILVRRLLRRGNFSSLEQMKNRILEFIDFFNRTMAKPFKWTYTGRPLMA